MSLCLDSMLIHTSMSFFFFNDTATTEIYTLSLHDALPISSEQTCLSPGWEVYQTFSSFISLLHQFGSPFKGRSEEHTSELQSRQYLVCRLLLEKKKNLRVLMIMTLLIYFHPSCLSYLTQPE